MPPDSTAANLDAVRAALAAGERTTARASLMQIVRAPEGRDNGEAWWLLAQTLDDPQQQADCYARASAAGYAPQPASVPVAARATPTAPESQPAPIRVQPDPGSSQPAPMPTVVGDPSVAMPSATWTPVAQSTAAADEIRPVATPNQAPSAARSVSRNWISGMLVLLLGLAVIVVVGLHLSNTFNIVLLAGLNTVLLIVLLGLGAVLAITGLLLMLRRTDSARI